MKEEIPIARLSILAMVAGGEKKISRVLDWRGHVQNWVGIGWVDEGAASPTQLRTLPRIKYEREVACKPTKTSCSKTSGRKRAG